MKSYQEIIRNNSSQLVFFTPIDSVDFFFVFWSETESLALTLESVIGLSAKWEVWAQLLKTVVVSETYLDASITLIFGDNEFYGISLLFNLFLVVFDTY